MSRTEDIDALAQALGRALAERRLTVTTAESCTGGLIAAAITSVPGSSAWFHQAVVTYANEAKCELAGVPADTLHAHGAVSRATVRAMAEGVLERFGADVAIAVSGVAGPGGGSEDKPVGTVWVAVARTGHGCDARHHLFPGDRAEVRRRTVVAALRATLSVVAERAAREP